jgi:hypothetical protein
VDAGKGGQLAEESLAALSQGGRGLLGHGNLTLPGLGKSCPSCSHNLKNHACDHRHRVVSHGSVPKTDVWEHSLKEKNDGS